MRKLRKKFDFVYFNDFTLKIKRFLLGPAVYKGSFLLYFKNLLNLNMQKAFKIIASSAIAGEVNSAPITSSYKAGVDSGERFVAGEDPYVKLHPIQSTVYKPEPVYKVATRSYRTVARPARTYRRPAYRQQYVPTYHAPAKQYVAPVKQYVAPVQSYSKCDHACVDAKA